jgi:hypothetical protein
MGVSDLKGDKTRYLRYSRHKKGIEAKSNAKKGNFKQHNRKVPRMSKF